MRCELAHVQIIPAGGLKSGREPVKKEIEVQCEGFSDI